MIGIGFTLDSIPGDNGATADCSAISVQTHGYIDIAYREAFAPNKEVCLNQIVQPPQDVKLFDSNDKDGFLDNLVIGHMVSKLSRMPSDAPDAHRVRIRLDGDTHPPAEVYGA